MPHAVGMLPITVASQVKSGVIPDCARKTAALGLAMIQRRFGPPLGTFAGRSAMRTADPPPSPLHLKTVSREWRSEERRVGKECRWRWGADLEEGRVEGEGWERR